MYNIFVSNLILHVKITKIPQKVQIHSIYLHIILYLQQLLNVNIG